MSVLYCGSSCTLYVCISTSPTLFTGWYSSKHKRLQLRSCGSGTLGGGGGSLGCFLFGIQKVYFIVYEQKDAELKLRIIPLIFATFCEDVHKLDFSALGQKRFFYQNNHHSLIMRMSLFCLRFRDL